MTLLKDYFTEDMLAAELGISARTLKRWRSLGQGPCVTFVGKRPLYSTEAIRNWLSKQQQTVSKRSHR